MINLCERNTMQIMTNSFQGGRCCALCQYWCGEAVEQYDFSTGDTVYEDSIKDICECHNIETSSHSLCDDFQTEYIYSRRFHP